MTSLFSNVVSRVFVSATFLFFSAMAVDSVSAQRVYQVRPLIPPPPVQIALEPGDVILAINGQRIHCTHDLAEAIDRSHGCITLTVRDCNSGRVTELETHLRAHGIRFGVRAADNHGRGVLIVDVFANSPAMRCFPIFPVNGQNASGHGSGSIVVRH